jgi:hypothetical protein
MIDGVKAGAKWCKTQSLIAMACGSERPEGQGKSPISDAGALIGFAIRCNRLYR